MKTVLLGALLLLVRNGLVAQNLVPNPGFEDHTQCPDNGSSVSYATGWWGVNNSPDYHHNCSTWPTWSTPVNIAGEQVPFDGNAYIGVVPFNFTLDYREVVGCELLDSVKIGNTYFVSMRVSRANGPTFTAGSNKLGMRFSNTHYDQFDPVPIDNFAHVFADTVITDSTNWVLLSWVFTPVSSYKKLYIGNFFDDSHTDTVQLGPTPLRAYYYIDLVEVICLGQECTLGVSQPNKQIISLYPNPASGVLYVQSLAKPIIQSSTCWAAK